MKATVTITIEGPSMDRSITISDPITESLDPQMEPHNTIVDTVIDALCGCTWGPRTMLEHIEQGARERLDAMGGQR